MTCYDLKKNYIKEKYKRIRIAVSDAASVQETALLMQFRRPTTLLPVRSFPLTLLIPLSVSSAVLVLPAVSSVLFPRSNERSALKWKC